MSSHGIKNVTSGSGAVNFFLKEGGSKLTNLHLNKLLYIAHGIVLAITDKPLLNPNYKECVEAWKYGPVIPSIYHELRCFGKDPVSSDHRSLLLEHDEELGLIVFEPKISDDRIMRILGWVLKKFSTLSATALVNATHSPDSPWNKVYKEGLMGLIIQDKDTKRYYADLLKFLKERDLYREEDIEI